MTEMSKIRTYSELRRLETFKERYEYLALNGTVGRYTFGFDRWINQQFYKSTLWLQMRHHVVVRDNGCDLGIEGYEIHSRLTIHHMNPLDRFHIINGDESLIDPEYLITTTHRTHNAIHFSDASILPGPYMDRRPGDTKLW
jgi:hypothetical protein